MNLGEPGYEGAGRIQWLAFVNMGMNVRAS